MTKENAATPNLQGQLIIGIDLGTTKSVVSVWDEKTGSLKTLPNAAGKDFTPSLVAWDRSDQQWVVGDDAKAFFERRPSDVVYSVKRFIGRWFTDPEVINNYRNLTYGLVSGGGSNQLEDVFVDYGSEPNSPARQSAPDISAHVLRSLREAAARALNLPLEEVKYAVVTVPAYFNVLQRKATIRAGQKAGLEVVDILNEPTAAALSYNRVLGSKKKRILVYDLGGGTFDISVLEAARDSDGYFFHTLLVDGDTHLGGDDIDMHLVDWLKQEIKTRYGATIGNDDTVSNAQLRLAAERTKVALGSVESVPIKMTLTLGNQAPFDINIEVTRDTLNHCAEEVIKRARTITETAVTKIGGLSWSDIDEVLLVGGQTLMPAIQTDVEQLTGIKPHVSERPQQAIALGAAEYGRTLSLGEDKFHQNTLINVIALPLGVRLGKNDFCQLVPANAVVPHISKEHFVSNIKDNQTEIRVEVLQGTRDATLADQCVRLGHVDMNILPRPAGSHKFKIVFDVKSDGTMKVTVMDERTGLSVTEDILETKTIRFAEEPAAKVNQ